MMVSNLLAKQIFSKTDLVDECFCNLLILLFVLFYCLLETDSILFSSFIDLLGGFSMGEYPCMVKRWVKPSLSLRLTIEILTLIKL